MAEYVNQQMVADYEAALASVEERKYEVWDVTVNEFDGLMDGNGQEVPTYEEGEIPGPVEQPVVMPGDAIAVGKKSGRKIVIAAADLGTTWVPYEE